MRYVLLTLLLILMLPASAEMYRWVDEKGKVHFSDRPPTGETKPYEPPPILTVPAGPAGDFSSDDKTDKKPTKYKSISIITPADDTVFTPDRTASIITAINLQPGLQAEFGHQVGLYLDGELYSKGSQFSFTLKDLPRGTHTLSAAVLSKKGNPIIKSDSISFHVQKHSL